MGRDQRRLRQRAGTYFMACHCLLWVVLVAAVGSFAQEEVLLANLLPARRHVESYWGDLLW